MNRLGQVIRAIVLIGAYSVVLALVVGRSSSLPASGATQGSGATQAAAARTSVPEAAFIAASGAPGVATLAGDAITPTGDCFLATSYREGVDRSIDAEQRASSHVVLVEVIDVGAPQWNTTDGAEPGGDRRPTPRDVVTPVVIQISESLKGDLNAGTSVTVAVPGGEIGCNRYRIDGMPTVAAGDSFAMFLTDLARPTGGRGGSLSALEIWPVVGSGVETPLEGRVSLSALRVALTR